MKKLPSREDYVSLVETFTRKLEAAHPEVCFYTFGSYERGDCAFGRSDIDGGIILNSGAVTPRGLLMDISQILESSATGIAVPLQLDVLDRETMADGRFLSYTSDYTLYLKPLARVWSRVNYLGEMKETNYKFGPLNDAAFNFCGPDSVRNALFMYHYRQSLDRLKFEERARKALEKAAKFPTKILLIAGGAEVAFKRREDARTLEDFFGINLDDLNPINDLLDNPVSLYREIDGGGVVNFLIDGLNCVERIVEYYIDRFPNHDSHECRG